MSGGHFDYKQYYIDDIADSIERSLENQGCDEEDSYTEETIQIMEEAVKTLRKAAIYAHRIDWFLSGDDGEETLKERLEEDLKKLEEYNEKAYKPADTFLDRMEIELSELHYKYIKLEAFIAGDKFGFLPRAERKLLARQHKAMEDYCSILQDRIKLAKQK